MLAIAQGTRATHLPAMSRRWRLSRTRRRVLQRASVTQPVHIYIYIYIYIQLRLEMDGTFILHRGESLMFSGQLLKFLKWSVVDEP